MGAGAWGTLANYQALLLAQSCGDRALLFNVTIDEIPATAIIKPAQSDCSAETESSGAGPGNYVVVVSVLTDQVEAQGEKIRDLESSLEEHRQKLASTEEMLQQELISRTSLETQKLDLMDEVSYLKLKLVSMEETHTNTHPQDPVDTKQNKAECVVDLISELQEQMCRFQAEISSRIQEKQAHHRRPE
ncbi:liprin-beta-2-like protein [Lates japonicus]|uniref:Liprin-beta-2-like protein n=1 Tax=Lates japonicus TaxID=270547 RepID=A0AAD3NIE6_LATJO|nr:liprin-beta-2-like protein [Lates japonicus]